MHCSKFRCLAVGVRCICLFVSYQFYKDETCVRNVNFDRCLSLSLPLPSRLLTFPVVRILILRIMESCDDSVHLVRCYWEQVQWPVHHGINSETVSCMRRKSIDKGAWCEFWEIYTWNIWNLSRHWSDKILFGAEGPILKLIIHLHPVLRSGMCGASPPWLFHVLPSMKCC
jgi:hypothetical protein